METSGFLSISQGKWKVRHFPFPRGKWKLPFHFPRLSGKWIFQNFFIGEWIFQKNPYLGKEYSKKSLFGKWIFQKFLIWEMTIDGNYLGNEYSTFSTNDFRYLATQNYKNFLINFRLLGTANKKLIWFCVIGQPKI